VGEKTDDATVHDKDNVYSWSAGGAGGTAADGTAFTTFLASPNSGGCFAGQCDWRKRLLSPNGFSILHVLGFNPIPHCMVPWPEIVRLEAEDSERSAWVCSCSAEELRWVSGAGTGFGEVRVAEAGEVLGVASRKERQESG